MTSTEKKRAAGRRAEEKHDKEQQEKLGDRLQRIYEITKQARLGNISYEERAKLLSSLTGSEEEDWMPATCGIIKDPTIRVIPTSDIRLPLD